MLRKATEGDLPEIREITSEDIGKCVYMYLDVHKYGLDNPDMELWVDRDPESDALVSVAMRYHDSLSFLSKDPEVDPAGFIELIDMFHPQMISGDLALIKKIQAQLDAGYELEEGWVYDITNYRLLETDVPIEPAKIDEMREIAALICSDESIGGYYDVDDLARQLKERALDGMGRNFVIRDKGRIFAHIATYAEECGIGVTAGMIVDPAYRDVPYGTLLESYLVESMRRDGLLAYTFVTQKKRARLLAAMGGSERGRYGKLTLPSA